jgi:hypothetical protein
MTASWPRVSLGELIRLERRPVEVIADREYQEIGTYSYGRYLPQDAQVGP